MQSLQQWQLSPLHTSVSVSGCVPKASRLRYKEEVCMCWQGILSQFKEKRLGNGRVSVPPKVHLIMFPPPYSVYAGEPFMPDHMSNTHMQSASLGCCLECIRMIQSLFPGAERRPVSVVSTSHPPGVDLHPLNPVSRLTAHLNSWDELRQVCFPTT